MNAQLVTTLVLLLGVTGCATPPSSSPASTSQPQQATTLTKPAVYIDRDIEGVWVIKKAELAGESFIEPGFQLWIKGDRFAVEVPPPPDRGRLIFHHQQSANEYLGLDVIVEEGPNQGRIYPTIYRRVNDELEICYDLSGRARPVEFSSRAGTNLFRVTYRRR